MNPTAFNISKPLQRRILPGVLAQVLCLLIAALLLDGGRVFNIAMIAAAAYWVGLIAILSRRGSAPMRTDRRFTAYGFLPLLVIVWTVSLALK